MSLNHLPMGAPDGVQLTTVEILGLILGADWVVMSAFGANLIVRGCTPRQAFLATTGHCSSSALSHSGPYKRARNSVCSSLRSVPNKADFFEANTANSLMCS